MWVRNRAITVLKTAVKRKQLRTLLRFRLNSIGIIIPIQSEKSKAEREGRQPAQSSMICSKARSPALSTPVYPPPGFVHAPAR